MWVACPNKLGNGGHLRAVWRADLAIDTRGFFMAH